MMNTANKLRYLTLGIIVAGAVLASGGLFEAVGQTLSRDPFSKPGWARTRDAKALAAAKKASAAVVNLGAPSIEQRIEYYKRLRENAVANGHSVPKVTSVLTLAEMQVTGIFRTPRGYAAMVEATPIKLSYTIYPGEKFFDGQLVAVEENRLVFRKVTKASNGKFVASVENKPLRQYSNREVVQGTAPAQAAAAEAPAPAPAPASAGQTSAAVDPKAALQPIVSPLDEMNKQVPEADKPAKGSKKGSKIARNK